MTIYEIDAEIQRILDSAVDENGEVNPDAWAQLESLQMEREQKAENCALAAKNHRAAAKAIKAEIETLTQRMKAEENQADRAGEYLKFILGGQKLKTPKVSVIFRETQSVDLDADFIATAPTEYLRFKDPEPNKKMIMELLKAGEKIPGAKLVTKTSMVIK